MDGVILYLHVACRFLETLSEGMEQETLLAVLSFVACNAPGVHHCEFKITIGG
jgi:hypothetical protein